MNERGKQLVEINTEKVVAWLLIIKATVLGFSQFTMLVEKPKIFQNFVHPEVNSISSVA